MTYMPDLTVSAERKAIGNYSFAADTGAQGAYTIFTITGDVAISIFGICKGSLTSGGVATIEVGVSGNTAIFIAQATATALLVNEIWHDATPTTTVESILAATNTAIVVSNGQDAIFTIGTADLTAGIIDFYALWKPLSTDANVVAV